jgi:predicted phosphodiesterase
LQSLSQSVAVLIIVAGLLLVLPASAEGMFEASGPNPIKDDMAIPYITSTTHNTTVIRWYPRNINPDNLVYANESFYLKTGSYDHTVIINKTSPSQMIFLSDLEAGTRYHYALQVGRNSICNQSFMTFPKNGSCSFIVYGDTREQAPYFTQTERHRIVADRISLEPNISFVINTGDLVSTPDDSEEWDRFFAAGKKMFATTTYAVVRGNHDSDISLLRELFGSDSMYSFDCGDAHIAVIDSTSDSVFSLSEQAWWLKADLATTDKWKILIIHHPLYTSEANHFGGLINLQKVFEPVFISGNVSAVFNAHVHAYERIEQSGITYVTEGRGGAPAYQLNATKMEGSVRSLENSLGYSRVTIDQATESMRVEVIQVADLSPDLREVEQIFPTHTVFDRIEFKKPGQKANHLIISSKSLPLLSDLFSCRNRSFPTGNNLSSGEIPFLYFAGTSCREGYSLFLGYISSISHEN